MREADKDGICISEADRTDLEEILKLQYLAYQSEAALFKSKDIPPLRQTLEEVEEELGRGTILKLVEDGRIVGSVRAYEEDGTVYIGKLMVHPDRQGRGYGSRLLSEIENIYPDKRYELFTST
ncbi:MAG TPA: GNAT family N-acetyltransferase, partial [Lachnospiraceae bacterium]|nr:GNAT family N-acetyltransferase [Lachnospiraceae bacterium]